MKTVLRQYLKDQDVENDATVRYIAAFVDLNDDGRKEVIVHVMSRVGITRPPILVLENKSNGWHDVTVWVQGGGIQPGYEADLPFDGESYITNPTVPPAHPLGLKTAGRLIMSDKAVGTPLD